MRQQLQSWLGNDEFHPTLARANQKKVGIQLWNVVGNDTLIRYMDKSCSPLVFVEFTFGDQSQSVVGNYTHKGKQIQWFNPAKRSHNNNNNNNNSGNKTNNAKGSDTDVADIPLNVDNTNNGSENNPINRFWNDAFDNTSNPSNNRHTIVFDVPESFVDEHVHATIYTVTNEGREKQFGYATIVLPKANGSMENEADKFETKRICSKQ